MAIIEAYGKYDNDAPGGANSGARFECIGGRLWRRRFRANQTICGNAHNTYDTDDPEHSNHATCGRYSN